MLDQDTDPLAIYNSIFQNSEAFVYRCHNDRDYTMQYMSGKVREICGHGVGDIIGNKRVSFVSLTHPDDKDAVFAQVDAAIEGKQSWNILYRLQRIGGTARWIREQGSAVYDAAGNVTFLQGLIVDAEAEVALREEITEMIQKTKGANQDILDITKKILRAEKHLSILSINAGIEAARAGDAGRGFAIIAQEIKARVDENGKWAEAIAVRMAS